MIITIATPRVGHRRPVRDDPPAASRTYTRPAVEVLGTVRSLTSKPRPGVQPIVMISVPP